MLTSYGEVPTPRHGEIIRGLGARNGAPAGVVSRRQMEVLERVRAHEERVQSSADWSVTKMRLFDWAYPAALRSARFGSALAGIPALAPKAKWSTQDPWPA